MKLNPPFVHPQGLCEATKVGDGTRVWAFAHVLPNAVIGRECNICDHVFIENDVVLGDRVTVKCGVQVWDGVRLENDVFVGPNATFTNDMFPRSRQQPAAFAKTIIKHGASIGANATILPGVVVGERAMIGAGAVVTLDVPPGAIVVGNPGRIVGYADESNVADQQTSPVDPRSARLMSVQETKSLQGSEARIDFVTGLPFVPQKVLFLHHVPGERVRRGVTPRGGQQFVLCIAGRCEISVGDGSAAEVFVLDAPSRGMLVPSNVWGVLGAVSSDAIVAIFSSSSEPDEVHDLQEFKQSVLARK